MSLPPTHRRSAVTRVALLLLCAAAWSVGVEAGSRAGKAALARGVHFNRLSVRSAVTIDPIRAQELGASAGSPIELNELGQARHLLSTRVLRRLDGLWTFEVDAESAARYPLQVQYELIGAGGRENALSLAGGAEQAIPVWVQPLPPRMIRQIDGTAVYEGGVELHLDLENVRSAGEYQGTLVVTVHRL